MTRSLIGLLCLIAVAGPRAAAGPPDPAALADRVDRLVATGWERAGVTPAAPADDAEFLRRASLDLIGRIPTVAEVRAFLEDADPLKRARLIDRLLGHPAYAAHFARFWRERWLP